MFKSRNRDYTVGTLTCNNAKGRYIFFTANALLLYCHLKSVMVQGLPRKSLKKGYIFRRCWAKISVLFCFKKIFFNFAKNQKVPTVFICRYVKKQISKNIFFFLKAKELLFPFVNIQKTIFFLQNKQKEQK